MSSKTSFDPASFSRWTGRTFASIIFCILVYRTIIAGMPSLNLITISMGVMLLGCVMAWFTDRYGGLVVLSGVALFYTISYADKGRFPSDLVYPFILVSGVLMLFSDAFHEAD